MKITTLPASEARERFSEIVNHVVYGDERIIVLRHGKPVAAVISAEDLERFEELEDLADSREMDAVLAKGETPISWEQAKRELGVK